MANPAKEVTFVDSVTVVSAAFLNLIQEVLAGLAHNVEIDTTGTSIRVQAGADDDAATIYIDGEFRFVVANITLDMAGKGSATYNIYATADTGDDAFALEVATGAPVATKYRKIGEVDWNGASISAVRTTVGRLRSHSHADYTEGGSVFDTATPTPSTAGGSGSAGSAITAARRDHKHGLAASTVPTSIADQAGAVGTSEEVARADHRHGWSPQASEFPSGTRLFFDQDTPPTGWTKIVTIDDRLLRVVSGTRGPEGGTWTQPTHTHTTPAHSHSHTHGSHSHTQASATGSGGGHSHTQGLSGAAGGHSHTQGDTSSAGAHTHANSGVNTGLAGAHSHTNPTVNADSGHTHTQSVSSNEQRDYQRTSGSEPGQWTKNELGASTYPWTHRHAQVTTSSDGGHGHTQGNTGYEDNHTHAQATTSQASGHVHSNPNTGTESDHQHTQATTSTAATHTHTLGSVNSTTPSTDATTASPTTNAGGTASTWRPAYRDVILAEKD